MYTLHNYGIICGQLPKSMDLGSCLHSNQHAGLCLECGLALKSPLSNDVIEYEREDGLTKSKSKHKTIESLFRQYPLDELIIQESIRVYHNQRNQPIRKSKKLTKTLFYCIYQAHINLEVPFTIAYLTEMTKLNADDYSEAIIWGVRQSIVPPKTIARTDIEKLIEQYYDRIYPVRDYLTVAIDTYRRMRNIDPNYGSKHPYAAAVSIIYYVVSLMRDDPSLIKLISSRTLASETVLKNGYLEIKKLDASAILKVSS